LRPYVFSSTFTADVKPTAKPTEKRSYADCMVCRAKPATVERKNGDIRLAEGWKELNQNTPHSIVICPECSSQFRKRTQNVELYLIEDDPEKRKEAYRYIRYVMQCVARARNFVQTAIMRRDACPTEASRMVVQVSDKKGKKQKKESKPRVTFQNWPALSTAVPDSELSAIYHESRAAFPTLGSNCLSTIKRDVVARYKKLRHTVRFKCKGHLPDYQSDESMPVYVDEYKFDWFSATDDIPKIRIKVGEQWFDFRVRVGYGHSGAVSNLRRHIREMEEWKANRIPPSIPGTQSMKFTLGRVNWHDNRPTVPVRDANGAKKHARFRASIFMWLPITPVGFNKEITMLVTPCETTEHLLRYNIGKFDFARFSGDKLRQKIAEYWTRLRRQQVYGETPRKLLCRIRRQRERMQGFSDDRKAGPRASAKNLVHPRTVASDTYEKMVGTILSQVASKLAKRAAKAGAASVLYADIPSEWDKKYRIPWKMFVNKLEMALETYGIPLIQPLKEEAAKLIAEADAAEAAKNSDEEESSS
jgi:hypothetical protein